MFKLRFQTDEWYTPAYAVTPILKYIRPNSKIWCPFDTADSVYVKVFKQRGHTVRCTHIDEGGDFFDLEPDNDCQYIISNPPFGKLTDVIERLLQFDLPFAMLCSLGYSFDNKKKFNLLKDKEISLLSLYPRVEFINGNPKIQNTRIMWQSAYLCYRFENMRQLEFAYLGKPDSKPVDNPDETSQNQIDFELNLNKIETKLNQNHSETEQKQDEINMEINQNQIENFLENFKSSRGKLTKNKLIDELVQEILALRKENTEIKNKFDNLYENNQKLMSVIIKKLS